MYRVLECITQEHAYGLLSLAVLACVSGSYITVLLTRRLLNATGQRRLLQIGLTSIIGGATIWSTHFLAMLAYDPGFGHGYDPVLTAVSLLIAVLGLIAANSLLSIDLGGKQALLAGVAFGLTISAMHYVGMAAYLLPGFLVWETPRQLFSIAAGAGLGAAAFWQIFTGDSRWTQLKGTLLIVLAICAMHFTAMTAFTIQLDLSVEVPAQIISDATLGALIMAVTVVILMIGYVAFSIEVNLILETRGQLQYAAQHDPLTGLPNRMGLARKLDEYTERLAQDEREKVAVLTIDLNLFKQVNDLHGHAAGDAVLTTLADRFLSCLEEDEFIARSGGDEFVALKRGFRRVEQVWAFAERLLASAVEPINVGDVSVNIGAAIGIATSIGDGREMGSLMHQSDLAMYRAKSLADGNICLFNAEIDKQSHARKVLVNDLRQALPKNQFELVYQLQNRIETREPTGFEVLLRWNHPTRGRVSPAEFIPIAEETGLIREIGLWVLRTACAEAASWPTPYDIAVNVAPQQLIQPSFVEHVADILMETRLAPERLELEVTEASIIDDQAMALKVMHKLKTMGIRIAMDDFGTGYSSLATLKAFPFDKIKIDRSFVQNVHVDEQRAAIVRSTLILGEALNIPVLAEGVEQQDELEFLEQEKCTNAQGYLFGQPLSLDELHEFIGRSRAARAS